MAWARLRSYVVVVLLTAGIAFLGDAAEWGRLTTRLVMVGVMVPVVLVLLAVSEKPRRR